MKDKIGIGILDIYNQELIDQCYGSIPEDFKENTFIASVGVNKLPKQTNTRTFSQETPLATMKNWVISQLRIKEYKYYFILDSNVEILDPLIFEKTIQVAAAFGVWFMSGPSTLPLPIEDDEIKVTLNVAKDLNTSFLFIYSGIIKNNGYFDERFFNTKNLDTLDYIIKLRDKNVYPPNSYYPIVQDGLKTTPSKIVKKNHVDSFDLITKDMPKDVQLSYGYFYHKHKYLPGQNDPQSVDKDTLLQSIAHLQKNYARTEL